MLSPRSTRRGERMVGRLVSHPQHFLERALIFDSIRAVRFRPVRDTLNCTFPLTTNTYATHSTRTSLRGTRLASSKKLRTIAKGETMELRWLVALTLWTLLSGPIFNLSGPNRSPSNTHKAKTLGVMTPR